MRALIAVLALSFLLTHPANAQVIAGQARRDSFMAIPGPLTVPETAQLSIEVTCESCNRDIKADIQDQVTRYTERRPIDSRLLFNVRVVARPITVGTARVGWAVALDVSYMNYNEGVKSSGPFPLRFSAIVAPNQVEMANVISGDVSENWDTVRSWWNH